MNFSSIDLSVLPDKTQPEPRTSGASVLDFSQVDLSKIPDKKSTTHRYSDTSVLPELEPYVQEASQKTGVDQNLIRAIIEHESAGGRLLDAPGSSAYGPMQLLRSTARELGVNPYNARENILGGTKYLKQLLDAYGSTEAALTAYFKGPGAYEKYGLNVPGTTGGRTAESYRQDILMRKAKLDEETRQQTLKKLEMLSLNLDELPDKQAPEPAKMTDVAPAMPKMEEPVAVAQPGTPEQPAQAIDSKPSMKVETGKAKSPSFRELRDQLHAEMMKRGEYLERLSKRAKELHGREMNITSDADRSALAYYRLQKALGKPAAWLSSFSEALTLGLGSELTEAQKEAQAENKGTAIAGSVLGGIGSALVTGGFVRDAFMKIPAMAKLAQVGKATNAMTQGERFGQWAFDAATRGTAVAGTSLIRHKDDLLSGDPKRIADAIKETAVGVAVSAIGAGPETMLPKGAMQPIYQTVTDAAVQTIGDALLLNKNAFTPEFWENEQNVTNFLINVGTSIAFSLNDIPKQVTQIKGGAADVLKPPDEKKVEEYAQKMARYFINQKTGEITDKIDPERAEELFAAQRENLKKVHEKDLREKGVSSWELAEPSPEDIITSKSGGIEIGVNPLSRKNAENVKRSEAGLEPIPTGGVGKVVTPQEEVVLTEAGKSDILQSGEPPYGKQRGTTPVAPISAEVRGQADMGGEAEPGRGTPERLPPPGEPVRDVRGETPEAPAKLNISAEDPPEAVLWDAKTGQPIQVFSKSDVKKWEAESKRKLSHTSGFGILSPEQKNDVIYNKSGFAMIGEDGRWYTQSGEETEGLAKQAIEAAMGKQPAEQTTSVEAEAAQPDIVKKLIDVGRQVYDAKTSADADKIVSEFVATNLKSEEDIDAAINAIESARKTSPKATEIKVDPLPADKADRPNYLQKAADAAAERIKERNKGIRTLSGFPIDDAIDYAIIGANKISKGFSSFAEWSKEMIKDFGETISSQLRTIWNEAKRYFNHVMNSEAGAVKLPFGGNEGAKKAIEAAAGVKKPQETAEELANLKAAFSKVQRFSKDAYTAGKIEGRALALAKMNLHQNDVEGYKDAALEYLKSKDIPKEDRAQLLVKIIGLRTPGQLKKFNAAVDAVEEKIFTRKAREAAQNAFNRAKSHKKLRPEYKRIIEAITDVYDPKGVSEKKAYELLRRKALEGTDVWEQIPDKHKEQIKRLEKRHINELSGEEAADLAQTIGHLISLNDTKQKFIIRGKDREHSKVLTQAIENISKSIHGEKKPPPEGAIPQEKPRGTVRKIWDYSFGREAENMELLLERIEGKDIDDPDAVLTKGVFGAIKEGRKQYIEMNREDSEATAEAFKKIGISNKDISKMSHIAGHTNLSEKEQLKLIKEIAETIELPSGKKIKITPAQRIGLYNTLKNPHGVRAVLDTKEGTGVVFDSSLQHGKPTNDPIYLSAKDVDAIIGTMSDKERAIGDYMFEMVNTVAKERLDKTSVDINGVEITIPNYWSMWRVDSYKNFRKGALKPEDMNLHVMKSLEGSGHLKNRKPTARGTVVIEDAFATYHNTMTLSAKYAAFADKLRQAKQLLHDIEPTARRHGFTRELAAIHKAMRDIEVETVGNLTEPERALRNLMGKLTSAGIGSGNPFVMTKQLLSLPGIATEGLGKYMGDAMKVLPGSAEEKRLIGIIEKYSPETNYRIKQKVANAELGDAASARELDSFYGTRKKGLEDIGTAGIGKFDTAAIIRIFKAAESKLKAEKGLTGDELGRETAYLAEKVIRRTQPMFSIEDRSAISRGAAHSTWLKLGTMFTSATNKINTMYKRSIQKYQRSEKTTADKVELIKNLAVVWASMSAGAAAVDEVRDWLMGRKRTAQDRIMRLIGNTLSAGYFTRPVVGAVEGLLETLSGKRATGKGKYEWATMDVAEGLANDAYLAGEDIAKAIAIDKFYKTGNLNRVIKGTMKAADVLAKMKFGISPLSIKRSYFDMPGKVVGGIIKKEHHEAREKYLKEVDYSPFMSRSVTYDGVEYLWTDSAYKKVNKMVDELVAAEIATFDKNKFDALSKEEKKEILSYLYKIAREDAKWMLVNEKDNKRILVKK